MMVGVSGVAASTVALSMALLAFVPCARALQGPLQLSLLSEQQAWALHRRRMLREGEGTRRNQTAGLLSQRRLQARPAEEIEEATLYGNTEPLGYFYAEVAIGTPAQRFHLVVDTRSSLTTVPCAGCTRCGAHTNTFFDPDQSSSYRYGCSEVPGCGLVATHSSCDAGSHCTYSITRRDGSSSAGELARDNVGMVVYALFGSVYTHATVMSTFGCQTSESGDLHAQLADGVLGLGLSEHSSHLTVVDSYVAHHNLRDTLTFCFSQTGGTMAFGADPPADHMGYFSTPLTPNGKYYSVQIREMSLGATPLGVEQRSYSTGGGVIFDTRTPFNYWPREVYQRLSDAFAAETAGMHLGVSVRSRGADCWPVERAPGGIASFPTITIRFAGAVAQQLHAVHYMFEHNLAWYAADADPQHPEPATHYCNGNFDHGSSRVVLGSLFMRHLKITFERVEQVVYMHEDDCGDSAFSTDNDSCDRANDGYCDEPYTCATGTDKTDCDELELGANPYCQYTDDGECDEITFCPSGSDTQDCCDSGEPRTTDPSGREVAAEQVCCGNCDLPGDDWCTYARDGVCDEPVFGTGLCPRTSDATDCSAVQPSCPWTGDGECDEGSYCAVGTDTADCCVGTQVRICDISEVSYCTPGEPVSDKAICGQASPPPPSIPVGADPADICASSDLVLDWSNGFHFSTHAAFGAQVIHAPDYSDLELAVARPLSACSALESNVEGKIALIRRGDCFFYEKALNAQDAGALAAVIYNHSPGIVSMAGSGMSHVDGTIHIPSIFIDMDAGTELHSAATARTTTATLHCQSAPLCPTARNDHCDEPYVCSPGTDRRDCAEAGYSRGGNPFCPYTNDEECDEGSFCPAGSDTMDCCDAGVPRDNDLRGQTIDPSDVCCGGDCPVPQQAPCQYADDNECDEGRFCLPGTDFNDCCDSVGAVKPGVQNMEYVECSDAAARLASTPRVPEPDSCQWAKDDECDEPLICPEGTDTTDCSTVRPQNAGGSPSPSVQVNAAAELPEDTSCGFLCTLPVVLIIGVCCFLASKRYNFRPAAIARAKLTTARPDNIYLSTASDDTADETASLTSAGNTDHNPLQSPESTSRVHQYRATDSPTSSASGSAHAGVAVSASAPAPSKPRAEMKPQGQVESILAEAAASVGVTAPRPTPEPEPASESAPTIGTSPADKAAARAAARATAKAVTAKAAPAAGPTAAAAPAAEEVMFWKAMDPSAVATALQGPAAAAKPAEASSVLQPPTTTSPPERPTAL